MMMPPPLPPTVNGAQINESRTMGLGTNPRSKISAGPAHTPSKISDSSNKKFCISKLKGQKWLNCQNMLCNFAFLCSIFVNISRKSLRVQPHQECIHIICLIINLTATWTLQLFYNLMRRGGGGGGESSSSI